MCAVVSGNKSRGSTRNEDEWKGIRMGKDRKMYGYTSRISMGVRVYVDTVISK